MQADTPQSLRLQDAACVVLANLPIQADCPRVPRALLAVSLRLKGFLLVMNAFQGDTPAMKEQQNVMLVRLVDMEEQQEDQSAFNVKLEASHLWQALDWGMFG